MAWRRSPSSSPPRSTPSEPPSTDRPEGDEPIPPPRPPFALPWPPLRFEHPAVALRPWGASPDDAGVLAAAWADPEIARWTKVPAAHSVDDAARWIAGEGQRRDQGTALDLVVTELGVPEAAIGEVGLVMADAERRWAEVGYWLAPSWRGGGRATVALRLFTDWVLRDLSVARLYARTKPANPVAGAVAERAGYAAAGDLPDGSTVWVRDAVPTG